MSVENPISSALPFYRRFVLILFAVGFVINVWAVTRYWGENLRDGHEFRQYQTAITAYYIKQDGLRLAYETPILGPPWSIPMEFPTYQIIVGKLSAWTALPLEQTGRLVSIFFFYAALGALWALIRSRFSNSTDPLLIITMALLSPILMFYSRTFMIESTALCFGLWFLVSFEKALKQPFNGWLPATWLLGSFAALTKVTTFAPICVPALFMVIEQIGTRRKNCTPWPKALLPVAKAALLAIVPLTAGAAWIIYSDHIKAPQPYANLLTSSSLRPFNLGTLAQRFTWSWWQTVANNSVRYIISEPAVLVIFSGLGIIERNYRKIALLSLACFFAGPLFFANLYQIHDYYFYATAIFLTTSLGLVCAGLLRSPKIPRTAAVTLVSIALVFQVIGYLRSYYQFFTYPTTPAPFEAEIVKKITPPDEPIAIFGLDWNSTFAYYAERRSIAVFDGLARKTELFKHSIDNLGERKISALVLARPFKDDLNFPSLYLDMLNMAPLPILRSNDVDVYVRKDLINYAVSALKAKADWGAIINLDPNPKETELISLHDLTAAEWAERLTMTSPAPFQTRGNDPIGILDIDGVKAIGTQAPTEIRFHPPAGSRNITAVTGMIAGSYLNRDKTKGVTIVVSEQKPDGSIHILFKRFINPAGNENDRGDITITYTQAEPFTGVLIFAHRLGPTNNADYAWSYWKKITIE